jgi:S1-C subfamily serine protease
VIVGPKWAGADEGLKYVARLKRLRLLYRIQGSPVSDEGIARLRAAIPGIDVQVRGAAKLGITNSSGGIGVGDGGCVIHDIQAGEAAANAGLKTQDRIVGFGGHRVDDFFSLIELLRSYKPNETVECVIVRDQKELKVPVTLTGWD